MVPSEHLVPFESLLTGLPTFSFVQPVPPMQLGQLAFITHTNKVLPAGTPSMALCTLPGRFPTPLPASLLPQLCRYLWPSDPLHPLFCDLGASVPEIPPLTSLLFLFCLATCLFLQGHLDCPMLQKNFADSPSSSPGNSGCSLSCNPMTVRAPSSSVHLPWCSLHGCVV